MLCPYTNFRICILTTYINFNTAVVPVSANISYMIKIIGLRSAPPLLDLDESPFYTVFFEHVEPDIVAYTG